MRLLRASVLVLCLAACREFPFGPDDSSAPTDLTYQLEPSGDPNAPLGLVLFWRPPRSGRADNYDVYGRSSSHGNWVLRATTSSSSFHESGAAQLQYYVQAFDGSRPLGASDVLTIDGHYQAPPP